MDAATLVLSKHLLPPLTRSDSCQLVRLTGISVYVMGVTSHRGRQVSLSLQEQEGD